MCVLKEIYFNKTVEKMIEIMLTEKWKSFQEGILKKAVNYFEKTSIDKTYKHTGPGKTFCL